MTYSIPSHSLPTTPPGPARSTPPPSRLPTHRRSDLAELIERLRADEAPKLVRCTYCGSNDDVSSETGLCRTCGREDA